MKLIRKTIILNLLFFIFNCSAHLEQNDKEIISQNVDDINVIFKKTVKECLDHKVSDPDIKNKCAYALFMIGTSHKVEAMNDFFNKKVSKKPFFEKGLVTIDIYNSFGFPLNDRNINLLATEKFHQDHPEYTLRLETLKQSGSVDITYRYSIEYKGYVTPVIDSSLSLLYFLGLKKINNEKI